MLPTPTEMRRTVNGELYATETASLLASDVYWDGHTWERAGWNTWLYRTPNGAYFKLVSTQLSDVLEPVLREEAIGLYNGPLSKHVVTYEEAFPESRTGNAC